MNGKKIHKLAELPSTLIEARMQRLTQKETGIDADTLDSQVAFLEELQSRIQELGVLADEEDRKQEVYEIVQSVMSGPDAIVGPSYGIKSLQRVVSERLRFFATAPDQQRKGTVDMLVRHIEFRLRQLRKRLEKVLASGGIEVKQVGPSSKGKKKHLRALKAALPLAKGREQTEAVKARIGKEKAEIRQRMERQDLIDIVKNPGMDPDRVPEGEILVMLESGERIKTVLGMDYSVRGVPLETVQFIIEIPKENESGETTYDQKGPYKKYDSAANALIQRALF